MHILFLGHAVGDVEQYSGASIAANKMQTGFLKALHSHPDVILNAITVPPISSYPKDKKILYRTQKIPIAPGLHTVQVGFVNLPVIKQICQAIVVYRQVCKMVTKDTIIISINAWPQVGQPALWLKRFKGAQIVSFVTDLPIEDNPDRKGFDKWIKHVYHKVALSNLLEYDKYIVMNKYAHDKYFPNGDYVVVDGAIDATTGLCNLTPNYNITSMKDIVYTGFLTEYSGVINLIKAMRLVEDKTIELHIYGQGYVEDTVKSMAASADNVKYMGYATNDVICDLQRKAWLLINPRDIHDPISMVSFPSKTFEYMLSGTPVLTTRLNGFSPEYDGKLFFAESHEPEVLADAINRISRLPDGELQQRAQAAKEFVIREKNWQVQAEKIYEFLNK